MEIFIDILIAISLFVVLISLGFGIYSLARGGEFNAKWGNRLMRYRVMSQAVAIGILLIGFWYKATH